MRANDENTTAERDRPPRAATHQRRNRRRSPPLPSPPPSSPKPVASPRTLIVGGEHTSNPIWRFLIDNMARLTAAGVRTFSLESLRDDSHQTDVDRYLSRGEMPEALVRFVDNYDRVRSLNPEIHAFLNAARRARVRVMGIDGRPARSRTGVAGGPHRRAATMTTYAHQVVTRDRARPLGRGEEDPGRYIMEIGAGHALAHHAPDGTPITADGATIPPVFPGLSDLLNVPAVEFTDDNTTLRRIRPATPEPVENSSPATPLAPARVRSGRNDATTTPRAARDSRSQSPPSVRVTPRRTTALVGPFAERLTAVLTRLARTALARGQLLPHPLHGDCHSDTETGLRKNVATADAACQVLEGAPSIEQS